MPLIPSKYANRSPFFKGYKYYADYTVRRTKRLRAQLNDSKGFYGYAPYSENDSNERLEAKYRAFSADVKQFRDSLFLTCDLLHSSQHRIGEKPRRCEDKPRVIMHGETDDHNEIGLTDKCDYEIIKSEVANTLRFYDGLQNHITTMAGFVRDELEKTKDEIDVDGDDKQKMSGVLEDLKRLEIECKFERENRELEALKRRESSVKSADSVYGPPKSPEPSKDPESFLQRLEKLIVKFFTLIGLMEEKEALPVENKKDTFPPDNYASLFFKPARMNLKDSFSTPHGNLLGTPDKPNAHYKKAI